MSIDSYQVGYKGITLFFEQNIAGLFKGILRQNSNFSVNLLRCNYIRNNNAL